MKDMTGLEAAYFKELKKIREGGIFNMEQEINGIDTITELLGEPPEELPIPFKLEYKQTALQSLWNVCYIAIIPYCFKCKVPLVWHKHPEGNTLFHCPNCNRRWTKGEGWSEIE